MNDSMEDVGYPTHILHNAAQIVSDVISADIDALVIKLFSYLSTYNLQIELLKDILETLAFCSVFFNSLTFKNLIALFNMCN